MPWLWTETPFVLFGGSHLAAIGIPIALGLSLAWLARRLPDDAARQRLSRCIAVAMVCVLLPMQIVLLMPAHYIAGRSLPLQICDVAWMAAIHSLSTHRRWSFALVYYWGFSATILAMLTPDLHEGFPNFYFLAFYASHGAVIVAAIYLCAGVKLRPDWRLYRLTAMTTVVYAVLIYFANSLLGTNFFCVNRKPLPGTMLDYFGPYPFYIIVCALIALSTWAALTLPWEFAAAKRRTRALA